jgi:transcriptional regulator with XRE-family HTH domain
MTLDALSERSGVDKQTILRIEHGMVKRPRKHTLENLARALGVEPAVLEGHAPSTGEGETPWLDRSPLKMSITDAAHNALKLTSMRYRILPEKIVELAPLLFCWAAETSLRRRAEQLDSLEEQHGVLQDIQSRSFPHHSYSLTAMDWNVAQAERQAIERRDLFGPDEETCDQPEFVLADGGDEEIPNPLERFLTQLAAETAPLTAFEAWSRYGDPRYAVCHDMALSIVDGDEMLADQILNGSAPLHRTPAALLKQDQRPALIEWLTKEAAASQERLARLFDDLFLTLDGDAVQPTDGESQ